MRRVLLALVIGTAFVFSAALAFADSERSITTKSIGTYGPAVFPGLGCDAGGCVGEVVTCAMDEALSPINQTYYYIRGICDDRGANGLLACAGRYVGYGEECSRPALDEHDSGAFVISRQTDGAFRICFSGPTPLGEGDCASADPVAQVIATGTTQSHTNHVRGTEILLGVGETILNDDDGLEKDGKWTADGKEFEWGKDEFVGESNVIHSQAQINGGRCPVTEPCGLSSTGVAGDD